ncbi:DegQ family serine endoprotease [Pontibacterium granulatum]|uniref:DegQ family serine endoprotease n=1 Tax=Pontibacterium granulatum TaxID=2036029 RepID=UPI00249C398C|nr:DegQ family serine endoprotease [Pontibacterium granulatum]MDI3323894.1 DegQ family serine endoprotease [Pontibacterium granulatum]
MNLMKRVSASLLILFSSCVFAGLPTHDSQGQPLPSLAPMLESVNSAVVNISTYSNRQLYNPLLNDPFFRRFFNIPDEQYRQQTERREQSAGSGVIVDAGDGVVLTNFHVIKDADEIQVSLIDGRSFKAELQGVDPELDIAVLKIDAKNLSEVKMSNSENLKVGDFVVAIGNPFGLGQTVTTGIVSALGRSGLGIEGYENFIQTDASINPGNSGGALVNLRGELIGINTAIISRGGGNIGIGFAIPTNMAKASMEQILADGEVRRGQLGVGIQDITSDLRDAFGLKRGEFGVLVTGVAEDSPAEEAGIEAGDIILSIDGVPTKNSSQLRSLVGVKRIGEEVKVALFRDGERITLGVKVGDPRRIAATGEVGHELLAGVRFENQADREGVVVTSLDRNSAAAFAGLRPGDLIVSVNRQRVRDLDDMEKALGREASEVLLRVNRGRGSFFVLLR